MLTFGVVVLSVADRKRAEEFWSAALGYEVREGPYGGWARVLAPPERTGPVIALQLSDQRPEDHPRLHFDLHVTGVPEQEAEAERLVALGGSRVDWDLYPDDPDFIVLADPDGNRFCIVDLAHEYV
jgi:catechol 2,3-dioxygenase-like lactoylglutathione lyase family enzyme